MPYTIGAAALTSGAGLLGSLMGANKQDKNAQAQRDWQEKMYLMDREYNTAANQRKRFEEAGLNPNLLLNGSSGSVSGSIPSTSMSNSGDTLAQGISSAGSSAAQMIAQQMDINAQKNVRDAESRRADEEADYTSQMTEAQRMQNMFLLQTLQAKTKNLQLKNVYQELENKYAQDSLDARVDLVTAQNQSLANRAYLDAMNAALADTQNRISKVNLAWLPAEKQAGLVNVIAQSALFASQRGMADAAARMYVSSAALNYAHESGIKLDNDFRKATQQLSIDATNDASRWTQQKYGDSQSPANKIWRWLGIDGSWLPAAGAYAFGKSTKGMRAPKKVKGFHQ